MNSKIMTMIIFIFSAQCFAGTGTAMGTSADDTEINKRDRVGHELTADQQSNSTIDMNITSRIRQDIMKEKNFSTYAQNIKIITVNGKVTLKGPVRSENERNSILKNARTVAGVNNVTNEISVVLDK